MEAEQIIDTIRKDPSKCTIWIYGDSVSSLVESINNELGYKSIRIDFSKTDVLDVDWLKGDDVDVIYFENVDMIHASSSNLFFTISLFTNNLEFKRKYKTRYERLVFTSSKPCFNLFKYLLPFNFIWFLDYNNIVE